MSDSIELLASQGVNALSLHPFKRACATANHDCTGDQVRFVHAPRVGCPPCLGRARGTRRTRSCCCRVFQVKTQRARCTINSRGHTTQIARKCHQSRLTSTSFNFAHAGRTSWPPGTSGSVQLCTSQSSHSLDTQASSAPQLIQAGTQFLPREEILARELLHRLIFQTPRGWHTGQEPTDPLGCFVDIFHSPGRGWLSSASAVSSSQA